MIIVKDYGYNYNVLYKDTKENYNTFFNIVSCKPGAKRLFDKAGWKLPKCYLPELEEKFEIIKEENPWDYIGEGLKLPPYCYQKESIKFGIDHEKCLLILPCGAGKTPILVGIYHELRKSNKTTKPGAIVVKASLKYQWVKEVEKFSNYRVKAIDSPSKAKTKFDSQFEDADIFVLNYETLKNDNVVKKLREKEIEVMLFD